jgi:ribosomal protein S18 acetylase RimI-like enzyme
MKISDVKNFDVVYCVSPAATNDELNSLFANAWENHETMDFRSVLDKSLAFVCAYDAEKLIGFVNVAWDGGVHAFLLDTTVRAEYRRRGIGRRLVEEAIAAARERGLDWLHVDFESHLQTFYDKCGFVNTRAGLINLKGETSASTL